MKTAKLLLFRHTMAVDISAGRWTVSHIFVAFLPDSTVQNNSYIGMIWAHFPPLLVWCGPSEKIKKPFSAHSSSEYDKRSTISYLSMASVDGRRRYQCGGCVGKQRLMHFRLVNKMMGRFQLLGNAFLTFSAEGIRITLITSATTTSRQQRP